MARIGMTGIDEMIATGGRIVTGTIVTDAMIVMATIATDATDTDMTMS